MEDYQKLLEENKELKSKVQKLESQVEHLKSDIEHRKESNRKLFAQSTDRGREIKRLKAHIEWLESKSGESEKDGTKE